MPALFHSVNVYHVTVPAPSLHRVCTVDTGGKRQKVREYGRLHTPTVPGFELHTHESLCGYLSTCFDRLRISLVTVYTCVIFTLAMRISFFSVQVTMMEVPRLSKRRWDALTFPQHR